MGFTMSIRAAVRMVRRYGVNNPRVDISDVIVARSKRLGSNAIEIRVKSKYTGIENLVAYQRAPATVTLMNRKGVIALKQFTVDYYTRYIRGNQWNPIDVEAAIRKYIKDSQRVAD